MECIDSIVSVRHWFQILYNYSPLRLLVALKFKCYLIVNKTKWK